MATDKQKEQLKGYSQAVEEMSIEIQDILEDSTIAKIYLEKLESRMREKVVRLVRLLED